jgi:uncharacterized protein (UPF0248 family)
MDSKNTKNKLSFLFKKEVMEKDALNRIKFDPFLNPEEFEIHYVDREKENLSQVNFSNIEIEGDFFKFKEKLIPMHRIRKITRKGKVVWDKRKH